MRTIFNNGVCIIIYDDYTFHTEQSDTSRVTGYLSFENVMRAHEVWVYKPGTKRFHAYKNKGPICEVIQRMADLGINTKKFAITRNTSITTELCFATPKDQFYFELKF